MTEQVWKHLPYAIYLDTNVLRATGSKLDAPWINELLSITTEYGISICISELVLAEWCQYLAGELEKNRQRLLASVDLMEHYGISVPECRPTEIELPEKKKLSVMVADKLKIVGIDVIPNWDAPLSELLVEAVAKTPPFEDGGKGLCDAVVVESYVQHAKNSFSEPRVLLVSHDNAVKRSEGRFKNRGVAVDFIDEKHIVEKVKSLLNEEVAAYIEKEKMLLREYVISHEPLVLDFVRKTPLKLTDWMLSPIVTEAGVEILSGTIEGILSVKPTKITDVIGGTPTYGEKISSARYPLRISVELELDVLVRDHGYGLFGRSAVVQPDTIDGTCPIPLESTSYDWKGRETTRTIRRSLTVLATLDAKKQKAGVLEDMKIVKIL